MPHSKEKVKDQQEKLDEDSGEKIEDLGEQIDENSEEKIGEDAEEKSEQCLMVNDFCFSVFTDAHFYVYKFNNLPVIYGYVNGNDSG